MAVVTRGAEVTIVTGGAVETVSASCIWHTGIVGADIVVVAINGLPKATKTVSTFFANSAFVAIVAGTGSRDVKAPLLGVAGIGRTRVQIVANQGLSEHAATIRGAALQAIADIAIIAHQKLAGLASCKGSAGFLPIAEIAVVALQGRSAQTGTIVAMVRGGTRIAIVARGLVAGVETARDGIAAIVGARIAVVAVDCDAPAAIPHVACALNGATVSIVAQQSLVGGNQGTGTAVRVTGGGQANGPHPSGSGADDHGLRSDPALVGEGGLVTKQRPIAQVLVL